MTTVTTSVAPYFDDYDEEKNFHKILFRPGIAVQARELTQTQDILQNQISKMGDNLYKEGAMIIPGNTSYDLAANYVKINPQFNGASVNLTALEGIELQGSVSGVRVLVVKTASQGTNETWVTIVYKTVANGGADGTNKKLVDNEILSADDGLGNFTVQKCQALTAGSSGSSSLVFINDGTYYVKGRFVNVYKQTAILSKYSNKPSVRVGLRVVESIVTENDVTDGASLLDPAFGSSNYNAPGAHRLKTTLNLEVIDYNADQGIDFVQLMVFNNGVIQELVNRTVFNVIGDVLADRTYAESGNYVTSEISPKIREHLAKYDLVNPLVNTNGGLYKEIEYEASCSTTLGENLITNIDTSSGSILEGHTIKELSAALGSYFPIGTYVEKIEGNTAYLSKAALLNGDLVQITGGGNSSLVAIGVDPNTFFVGGYEYKTPSTIWTTVPKARTSETVVDSSIQVTYGNYILVGDVFGIPSLGFRALVELRRGAISTRGVKNSRVVGLARVQGVELLSGTETNNIATSTAVYKLYITDISLNDGISLDDVASITSPGSIGTNQNISANVLTSYGVSSIATITTGSPIPFAKGDVIQGNTPDQKAIVYSYDPALKRIYTKRATNSFVQFSGTSTGASAVVSGVPAAAAGNLKVGMYVFGSTVTSNTDTAVPTWITALAVQADGTYQVTLNKNPAVSATPSSYTALYNPGRLFFASRTGVGNSVTLTGHTDLSGSTYLPAGTYLMGSSLVSTQTTNPLLNDTGTYITSVSGTTVNLNQNVGVAGTNTFAFYANPGLRSISKDSTITVKPTSIITAYSAGGTAPLTIKVACGIQDVSVGSSVTLAGATSAGYVTAVNTSYNGSSITVSGFTGTASTFNAGTVLSLANNTSTLNNSAVVSDKTIIFESNDPTLIFELPHTAIKNNVGADGTFPPNTTVTMKREQFINVGNGSSTANFNLSNPNETLPVAADSKHFYGYYIAHSDASLIGSMIPASAFTINSSTTGTVAVTSGTNVKIGIVYLVSKAKLQQRTKTLHSLSSSQKISNVSPGTRNRIYLGLPDVYKVVGVWDSHVPTTDVTDVSSMVTWDAGTATWVSTTAENITQNWTLDNGQRDDHYEQGSISLKANAPVPQGKLIVVFEYFTSSVGDYFNADSYSSMSSIFGEDYLSYIPHYTDSAGVSRILQNCFDFRQYTNASSNIYYGARNSGQNKIAVQAPDNASGILLGDTVTGQGIPDGARVYSIAGNTLTLTSTYPTLTAANCTTTEASAPFAVISLIDASATTYGYRSMYPSNMDMVVNNTGLASSYSHYLPRVDKLVFNSNGRFNIVSGTPAKSPSAPVIRETESRMVLFDIIVPEYTYAASSIHIVKRFQRGYTMRDIGGIETRLKNLEDTVALSLLEQDTNSMLITDSSGLNRFKSGFVVDNFKTESLGDFDNPEYNVSIDVENGVCRPSSSTTTVEFGLDTSNVENANFIILDNVMMLPFVEEEVITQPWATSHISVNPFAVFIWNGTIKLNPSIDTWIDYKHLPDIVNTVYINNSKSSRSGGGNRVSTSRSTSTTTSSTTSTSIKYV